MGTMKYKISSRATILLGRESVSKVDGAIIELVKNTYDADADMCFLCFDIKNDCIYIIDNGIGMTKETIENYWMMIGTNNKQINYQSKRNRIKSGEKGIGRFALDRLGSKCEMYTYNELSPKTILWTMDWNKFEEPNKILDDINATFEYLDTPFEMNIPKDIYDNIQKINESNDINFNISLKTGTILKISQLRDNWTEKSISKIINTMNFLLPPKNLDNDNYIICVQKSLIDNYILINNDMSDDFDYKLSVIFDGNNFHTVLLRNEFDVNKMPKDLFKEEAFKKYPLRKEDFILGKFENTYSIESLLLNSEPELINNVKKIGSFRFEYTFMKISPNKNESFYNKEISPKRKVWLKQYSGIKIYRDNFLVRPYGDPNTDSYDWLGLDARKASSPASIARLNIGNWCVRNGQSVGSLFISRINNNVILDKSSREGIIENDSYFLLKNILIKLISIFENDRMLVFRNLRKYFDEINKKEIIKKQSLSISKEILCKLNVNNEKDYNNTINDKNNIYTDYDDNNNYEKIKTLAKAVKYFEEEKQDLIDENKILRALATNGLITTSIVHDLKTIDALLVNRISNLEFCINMNDKELVQTSLNDLKRDDRFLKAWISVITEHIKKDKRTRKKQNIYEIIENILRLLFPILKQKEIDIKLYKDDNNPSKKIIISDFECIFYNLIINSIESFEKSSTEKRIITINLKTIENNIIIDYSDNGNGIDSKFENPYDIFKYGITSKIDNNGNMIGTGLGMYIVSSTLNEYHANYKLAEKVNYFSLEMIIPL
ncbi:ATP-binding protein [Megamonas funiformis]|uniref:ATP-binding protein n=1 Tax=Megamonas funiformis TaxID=437897 RepID=UPI00242D1B95|nr:ATP-binding protein [Megamonas funiformis]